MERQKKRNIEKQQKLKKEYGPALERFAKKSS